MNEARKEKLKRLILKLPFGLQLLQLRRKIISQHQVRKREMKLRRKAKEREIMLRRKEKRQTRMLRYKIKKSEIAEKERLQQVKLKTKIRQKKVPLIQKNLLWHKASLSYSGFYRYRSTEILDIFQRYSHVPLEQATAFEIGTGVYLSAPIGLSLLGFQKVITIDIRRAVPKYVQMVLKYYQKHGTNLGITRCPKIKAKLTDENLDSILLNHFNIDYRAPYDAAHTDLPDNSVDYVFSQETFEHIRTEILHDIVNEAFRILHGGQQVPRHFV